VDASKSEIVVTEADFRTVADKLTALGLSLSPAEQVVIGYLIDTATDTGDAFGMSSRPEGQQPVGFQYAPGLDPNAALVNTFGGIRQALPAKFGKVSQTYYKW
jgi:hypothetical protein